MSLNHDTDRTDLDWAAFCYAVGELDAAAAENFELRLAGDQRAREALARAVELCQAVAAAESLAAASLAAESLAAESLAAASSAVAFPAAEFPAAEFPAAGRVCPASALRENSPAGFSFSWLAIGGLAAAVLVIVGGIAGQSWQAAERWRRSAMKERLASAWYETRTEIANEKETGLWPASGAIGVEIDDDVASSIAAADFENEETPSWLNVAVILAHDRAIGGAANPAANRSLEN